MGAAGFAATFPPSSVGVFRRQGAQSGSLAAIPIKPAHSPSHPPFHRKTRMEPGGETPGSDPRHRASSLDLGRWAIPHLAIEARSNRGLARRSRQAAPEDRPEIPRAGPGPSDVSSGRSAQLVGGDEGRALADLLVGGDGPGQERLEGGGLEVLGQVAGDEDFLGRPFAVAHGDPRGVAVDGG